MTRHVVAKGFGGPEQLVVVEVPTPDPGEGQVRVAVHAIGVNPIDWKSYSGVTSRNPESLRTFGFELSGVVDAVGEGVDGWSVGDEVIAHGFHDGAYADAVVVPATTLLAKPAGMSFEQAAVVALVGGTAWHLVEAASLDRGETVLVHNGSGGVGSLVVQLARLRGARVVATGGPENQERLRELGAVPVVYGDGLLDRVRSAAPEGVDVALDCVGTDEAIDASLALVADPGRVISIAAFGRAGGGIRLLGGGPGADPGTQIRAVGRAEVVRLVAEGRLTLPIVGTFRLEETARAHAVSRAGHVAGKLVVVP